MRRKQPSRPVMFTCIITAPVALYRQATGIPGGVQVPLTAGASLPPPPEQIARFPQLANGYTVPSLSSNIQAATYMGLLQRQSAVPVVRSNGNLHYATSVQDAGVPDDLYSYKGRFVACIKTTPLAGASAWM